jgi:hypothetical protein
MSFSFKMGVLNEKRCNTLDSPSTILGYGLLSEQGSFAAGDDVTDDAELGTDELLDIKGF